VGEKKKSLVPKKKRGRERKGTEKWNLLKGGSPEEQEFGILRRIQEVRSP